MRADIIETTVALYCLARMSLMFEQFIPMSGMATHALLVLAICLAVGMIAAIGLRRLQ